MMSSAAAPIAEEEQELPVSPNSRVMHAPNFNLCIMLVMAGPATIDVTYVKKSVEQTLVKHPRFSSILVVKDQKRFKFSWKRTKVDVANHIFVPTIDPDSESGDQLVEDFISNLAASPMDLTRPLWEVHVLNVKTSHANSIVIMRLHHSMGDGVSLTSVILACSKKSSDPESLPVLPVKKKQKVIPRKEGISIKRMFVLIWKVLMVLYYTLIDTVEFLVAALFVKDTETPIKGVWSEESRKRYVHKVLSLEDVKMVKNAMNVTVNDVIFAITEAALSHYLLRRYENNRENGAENTKKTNVLPKRLRIRTVVAINLRESVTIEDMSDVMENGKKLNEKMWGNLVGFVLLPLKICVHEDPLTYIHRAKALMDRKKLSLQPLMEYYIANMLTTVFGIKVVAGLVNRIFTNITVAFSSVVGPVDEISIFGYPVTYIAPTVTGPHIGIVIHHLSYANKLIVSMALDEKLIPDPHQLCDDFQRSLQSLKDAVILIKGLDTSQTMQVELSTA